MLTDQTDRNKFLYMDGHTDTQKELLVIYCLALCGNCEHTMNVSHVNQVFEFCLCHYAHSYAICIHAIFLPKTFLPMPSLAMPIF